MNCPQCGSANIRRSRYGTAEYFVVRLVKFVTLRGWYRCRDCDQHFVGFRYAKLAPKKVRAQAGSA
jgi:transposase-like protein